MWQLITGGFLLGMFGSMHCVGMCGPLALVIPVHHLSPVRKFFMLLLYQLGRVITYASLGLIFGLLGKRIYIAGFQRWLSIGLGLLIILLLILFYVYKRTVQPAFMQVFYKKIQQIIITILQSGKSGLSYLGLGMANGLLPCGMVYVAIAAALTAGSVSGSVYFMAAFGLGTLPAMTAFSYFGTSLSLNIRRAFRRAIPVGIAVMACLLILRGMNLGIPFVSPVLHTSHETAIDCHK